ncbi:MAG: aminopeptidase N, partial [Nocardiaceae bacterium]|nr:aminopeptidase N [Nocardiaceae bacterium]
MAPPNLTREQAAERSALVSVDNYRIDLDLTDGSGRPGETTFRSRTTVIFGATAGSSTFIDIIAATVHSAVLNGTPVDVSSYDESTGITLSGLAESNELVVDADCMFTNTGEGLHRFVDPTDNAVYLYSQFETADAKRMFACFDQPDLKATFDIAVTAPEEWTVVSNAETVQTLAATPGRHVFRTTPRMSTYLVALIAGPYAQWSDSYSDEHGTIPLGIYCRSSLAEYMDNERLFTE